MPRQPMIVSYPLQCANSAAPIETVSAAFEIGVSGAPENIKVVKSSNSCFDVAVVEAVEDWRFWLDAGRSSLAARRDVSVDFSFEREDRVRAKEMRSSLRRKFDRIWRHLDRNRDPKKALARLDKIGAKYGEDFSALEQVTFHMLKATAWVDTGDYESARSALNAAQDVAAANDLDLNAIEDLRKSLDVIAG